MRSLRSVRSLALTAAMLVPALALGNGRPPITNGIQFQPGDERSLYLATTFGLLVSHDDGCTFRWICEQNIGYGGTFDPKWRVARDGTLFATTFTGLRVSRDGGCTFATATEEAPMGDPGRIADMWIDAIDIGPTGDVWVATAETARPNNVYRSTDGGRTFAPGGMLSPTIWWKSIAVAPTRGQRIYATGYQVSPTPPKAFFMITDDNGANWTPSPLADVRYGSTPLVLALGVDLGNPDIVLMSSLGANPPNGDRLYRSTDGGVTWTEVLATTASIIDVAIGRDGRVLIATFGGGSYTSSDRGGTFGALTGSPDLACIGERDDGALFGCGTNWEPDFKALARSVDTASWDKVFRFVEMAGPVECAAGTPQERMCGGQWPAVQQQFGTTGPAACNGGEEPPPPPPPPAPADSAGGCCDAKDPPPGQLGALALLAALCGVAVLRRRARR